jgi:hypothetical protein
LDSLQQIAADVSAQHGISSMDAAHILEYAVAMRNHFPVGYRSGLDTLDWAFWPSLRTYSPCTTNYDNEDYDGILYGDPSGNWPAGLPLATLGDWGQGEPRFFTVNMPTVPDEGRSQKLESRTQNAGVDVTLSESGESKGLSGEIPRFPAVTRNDRPGLEQVGAPLVVSREPSASFVFPLKASKARNAVSADALVRYDAGRYTLRGIRTTEQTEGFMVAAADRGGYVRISMAGTRKLNGEVVLLELVFGPAEQTAKDAAAEEVRSPNDEGRILGAANGSTQDADTPNAGSAVGRQPSAVSREPSAVSPAFEVLWLVLNEGASDLAGETGEGAMGEEKKLPAAFYLAPPKPNPFGTGTLVSYGLPVASEVGLAVFDATGRRVRTLVGGRQSAGRYSVLWNGCDDSGRRMANGVYFVRLKTPAQRFQRKVTLVRR